MQTTREIQDKIKEKKTRPDKNGKDFLILELENEEVIFVFDNKGYSCWKLRILGRNQRVGNRLGSNVLVKFKRTSFF